MGKKCKKTVQTTQDFVLVDGYYMPKMIVEPYKRMRASCIFEINQFFEKQGYSVATSIEDMGMFLYVKQYDCIIYRIALSPQHVSHIDKIIGTKKLIDYLETIKEEQ